MKTRSRDAEYTEMVAKWRSVVDSRLDLTGAQADCVEILRQFVAQIAISAENAPNPTLKFYANMIHLEWLLNPIFARDEFGQYIVRPAWDLVREWLRSNRFAR